MLKGRRHISRHVVPLDAEQLTGLEHEAYQAALAAVHPEFTDFAAIAETTRRLETSTNELTQPTSGEAEIVVGHTGERWRVQRRLSKLDRSEVVLCQKGGDLAVVERFPTESAYAQGNGDAEVLLTGSNERILLQDFVQNERQALRLMAADLREKVSTLLVERYPNQDLKRVTEAFSRRCNHELREGQSESQSTTATRKPVREIRI